MNVRLTSVIAAAVMAISSAAAAEITYGLKVHYEFEDSRNFGKNSAGTGDGTSCG